MARYCRVVFPHVPLDEVDHNVQPDASSLKDERAASPDHSSVSHFALGKDTKWGGNGIRLRVAFIDKPAPCLTLQQRIVGHMNDWSDCCNVRFTLLHSEDSDDQLAAAEVRISFSGKVLGKKNGGYWSCVGTGILQKTNWREPTMMLTGYNTDDLSSVDFIRNVLHETGHTLGLAHEHLRSEIVRRIDKKKGYDFWREKEDWNKSVVDYNVLRALKPSEYLFSEVLDLHSIMCYPIDESILKDGMKDPPITGGNVITEHDKELAGTWYPVPEYEAKDIVADRDIVGITASEKALYLLMKNGDIKAYFEMNGRPEKHIIDKVEDPTKTTLIASDDTLYKIENEFVVSIWRGSPGDDRDDWHQVNGRSIHDIAQVDIRGNANYYLDNEGRVVMYDGNEHGGHWRTLNKSGDTLRISSTNTHLYLQNESGEIYQMPIPQKGTKFNWRRVDKFTDTLRIATNWRHLYQQRENGEVWVYTGTDRYWTRVYQNQGSQQYRIEAYEDRLFRIEEPCDDDASGVWVNDDNTEGGWKPLKIKNSQSFFVYTGGYVYEFVKDTGEVTRYTGIC
ncbi:hypothetical protein PM082_011864 [Marasmius tenuissimus]|nr:hypothetical protein PM082_011864 [Marasmius tenuissimus]